jgi:A/G-specific adenine glycosylase
MLQQTQVDRVVPKFKAFIKKFPSIQSLSRAPLSAVLQEWQGLGYNRRAKHLHQAVQAIVRDYRGIMPRDTAKLQSLPGIGPYTARAIMTFAHNAPEIFIETNIRSVFIHHFFPNRKKVSDTELMPYIESSLDIKNPQRWYSALMDYGAHLKKTKGNASRRSTHHAVQKPFKGSDREVRGAVLRALAKCPHNITTFSKMLPFSRTRTHTQISRLIQEGLVSSRKGKLFLG